MSPEKPFDPSLEKASDDLQSPEASGDLSPEELKEALEAASAKALAEEKTGFNQLATALEKNKIVGTRVGKRTRSTGEDKGTATIPPSTERAAPAERAAAPIEFKSFQQPADAKDWSSLFGVPADAADRRVNAAVARLYDRYDLRRWKGTSHEEEAKEAIAAINTALGAYKEEKTARRKSKQKAPEKQSEAPQEKKEQEAPPTSASLVESIAGLPPAAAPEAVTAPESTLDAEDIFSDIDLDVPPAPVEATLDAQDIFPGLDLPVVPDPADIMPTGAPQEPEFGPPMPTLDESRKEYARAVQEMEGRFKGVRSLTSLPGMRKSNLLKGIEYVSEHKDGRAESLEEQLRQKGVHEKDIDIAAQIIRAREMHITTRTHEAQRMITEREQLLRTSGKTEDEIAAEIAAYKRGELFDKLIADENEKLQQLHIEGWPPKKKSLLTAAVNKWAGMSKTKRIALSTLLFTGVAFGAGAFATTGAIGAGVFAGGKALRSVGAGILGKMTSELAGKAYDAGWGKKNIEASAKERVTSREKLAADTGAAYDALRAVLAQADKDYQSSIDRLSKNRRNKAIIKGVTGVVVAGSAGLLQGAFDAEPAAGATGEVLPHEQMRGGVPQTEGPSVEADTSEPPPLDQEVLASRRDPFAELSETGEPAPETDPSHPESVKETMISIRENGNVWNSAKILGEHHGLDKKAFAEAWANSKATLPDGRVIPIAELDLVHANDTLSYVVGENGEPGHFEFKNTSNIDHGDVLPGERKPEGGFRELSINEVVAADNGGFGPTIEVTDPYANLDPDAPVEGMLSDAPATEGPETAGDQSWREADHERAVPPASPEYNPAETGQREWLANLHPDTPEFETVIDDRIRTGLESVFGEEGGSSKSWDIWRRISVRHLLDTPPTAFTENTPGLKLQQYVQELIQETGTRPRFRLFGNESVEEFIERAHERGLKAEIRAARASLR